MRPAIDFEEIKRRVDVYTYLIRRGWTPTRFEPRGIRGPCPVHGSTSRRSRSLVVNGRVWHCFWCGAGGDVIKMHQLIELLDAYEAALGVCAITGITVPLLRSGKSRNGEEVR